ncbi:MAG TPA: hypothetical protein VF142_00220 [Longimicrobium sp.]
MEIDLVWLAERVGRIDTLFRRGRRTDLPEQLCELAEGLPPEVPADGFRDASALAASGRFVDAWNEYNRALSDFFRLMRTGADR